MNLTYMVKVAGRRFGWLASVCILLAGCTAKDIQIEKRCCEITADAGAWTAPSTKTQVGDLTPSTLYIHWSEGDRIGVTSSDGESNICFTNVAGVSPTGKFEGMMGGDASIVRAYYPYVEGADVTSIPVVIPTEQAYFAPEDIAGYDVRVATDVSARVDGGCSMQFRSLTSILRFVVDLDGLTAYSYDEETGELAGEREEIFFDEGEELLSLELSLADDISMTSDEDAPFVYDLTSSEPRLEGGNSATLLLNYEAYDERPVVGSGHRVVLYAVVAPGAEAGTDLSCAICTSSHWFYFETTLATDLEPGKFYTVPVTAEALNTKEVGHAFMEEGGDFYEILVDEDIENGTIEIEPEEYFAQPGDVVRIIATPEDGYHVESYSVINIDTDEDVEVSEDGEFEMPEGAVLVSVTFAPDQPEVGPTDPDPEDPDPEDPDVPAYTWNLVTSVSELVPGAKLVIAGEYQSTVYENNDYVTKTFQKAIGRTSLTNPAAVAAINVTIENGECSFDEDSGVLVFTVLPGTYEGQYYFVADELTEEEIAGTQAFVVASERRSLLATASSAGSRIQYAAGMVMSSNRFSYSWTVESMDGNSGEARLRCTYAPDSTNQPYLALNSGMFSYLKASSSPNFVRFYIQTASE